MKGCDEENTVIEAGVDKYCHFLRCTHDDNDFTAYHHDHLEANDYHQQQHSHHDDDDDDYDTGWHSLYDHPVPRLEPAG